MMYGGNYYWLTVYCTIPAAIGGRQRIMSPGTKSLLATKILKEKENSLLNKTATWKKTFYFCPEELNE
jgi:hypothetical protein